MAEQFYTILTNVGKAKVANSLPTGTKVNLTKLKIGDSNGTYYNPSETQTDLVHKVYECNVTSVEVDEENPSWVTITSAIPSDVGGFMIREVGVFDDGNNLIAIGKYPETYKPVASDGSTKELYIKMTLEITNSSSVELKIDPTVIIATKKDIQILDNSISSINAQLSENMQNIAQLSNPNLLINGDFQVWQRDTSFTAPSGNTYLADRWNFSTYGSDVDPNTHCVVNKVDDGLSLVCTGATGTGNTIWRQPFESDTVKKLLGKIVTLSFSIKTSNIGQISAGFNVTSVDGFENPVNLKSSIGTSSDYVQYNVTFTIPKTASVFMPQILLKVPSGTSSYILKDVKLELGSMPTPFSPRPYAEELALCQRYYEYGVAYRAINGTNTTRLAANVIYKTEKRVDPSITITSDTSNNIGVRKEGVDTIHQVTIYNSNIKAINLIDLSSNSDVAFGDTFCFNWYSDAEIY